MREWEERLTTLQAALFCWCRALYAASRRRFPLQQERTPRAPSAGRPAPALAAATTVLRAPSPLANRPSTGIVEPVTAGAAASNLGAASPLSRSASSPGRRRQQRSPPGRGPAAPLSPVATPTALASPVMLRVVRQAQREGDSLGAPAGAMQPSGATSASPSRNATHLTAASYIPAVGRPLGATGGSPGSAAASHVPAVGQLACSPGGGATQSTPEPAVQSPMQILSPSFVFRPEDASSAAVSPRRALSQYGRPPVRRVGAPTSFAAPTIVAGAPAEPLAQSALRGAPSEAPFAAPSPLGGSGLISSAPGSCSLPAGMAARVELERHRLSQGPGPQTPRPAGISTASPDRQRMPQRSPPRSVPPAATPAMTSGRSQSPMQPLAKPPSARDELSRSAPSFRQRPIVASLAAAALMGQ